MFRKLIGPAIILIVAAGAYFAYRGWQAFHYPGPAHSLVSRPAPKALPKLKPKPSRVIRPTTASAPLKPRAAIVIDDVAYNLSLLDQYASLQAPLTLAVLPGEKRAKEFSGRAHHLGFEVIIHLPLEPVDAVKNNPGQAGLLLHMTPEEMKRKFDRDVETVPDAVGVNNHMGSAFTENEFAMTNLLGWVKGKGMFFLDSRTSQKSVAARVAKRMGLAHLTNHTFLDNVDETEAIKGQLDKVMGLALRYKRTVAIGHYRRKYLHAALQAKLPEFRAKGIELVVLSDLLKK